MVRNLFENHDAELVNLAGVGVDDTVACLVELGGEVESCDSQFLVDDLLGFQLFLANHDGGEEGVFLCDLLEVE